MSQFILKITLGNEAMQTGSDIAEALKHISRLIGDQYHSEQIAGRITDINGNNVGSYQIK